MPLNYNTLRAFPKVELHVHVEACISAETIERLAGEAGVPMLRPSDKLFNYNSLAEFLETFEWWVDLLRTPAIAEQVAYEAAKLLHEDGIVYAELFCGPRYWGHIDYAPLITALNKGLERAHRDGYSDCYLLPSISREQSAEWAFELLEWIARERPTRVVGLGLDGNEELLGRTCQKFAEVFKKARELGLGTSCHTGESSGPEGVWDAVEFLKIDRIDHGVRAVHDPELVACLARAQVPMTICPTSNIIVGLYNSISDCPIGQFIEAGIPVTVNSDDPCAMQLSLSGELLKVGESLDWTMDDVATVTRNAINAAYCDQDKAQQLHRQVAIFLESL